jgi:hypothetical protein
VDFSPPRGFAWSMTMPLPSLDRSGFYPSYYLRIHPDLEAAFGLNDDEAAEKHYIEYGLKEGRSPNSFLLPKYYLAHYPDLQHAFGPDNYKEAAKHWINYGVDEGRRGSHPSTFVFISITILIY